jgi:hypothetical protein
MDKGNWLPKMVKYNKKALFWLLKPAMIFAMNAF